MSKILLLGDVHIGAKSDAEYFHNYVEKFFKNILFPYIDKHKISHIIQVGDLFDRRKYINFLSLSRSKEYLFDEVKKRNLDFDIIIGNHCCFYKNTNKLNSPSLLLEPNDKWNIHWEPSKIDIGGTKIDLIPWINSANEEDTLAFIKNSESEILLGHLEVDGFSMYRGIQSHGGLSKELLSKYELVCSGHYHHKSTQGNVNYLGSPYQITWHDHGDMRGFHILDTDTKELDFIENPHKLFEVFNYEESDDLTDKIYSNNIDLSFVKDRIVKVRVNKKNNHEIFDLFVDRILKQNPIDLKIEDVSSFTNSSIDDDVEVENTADILVSYVKNIECEQSDKDIISKRLMDVYFEALNIGNQ
jgi:DNA repair exonuclease SbcCD nuclease subunit